ncbi:MAG: AAA family ATPase [Crenarchaeota archaeon]|nr:AAA family ATPase [Thermoproteota archaeon]
MITRVSVKNYACIEECDIQIKPLTVFIGDNASGKTLLINALLNLLDILTGENVSRIPLYHVLRKDVPTIIGVTFRYKISTIDVITQLMAIMTILASKGLLNIPDTETLINMLSEITGLEDSDSLRRFAEIFREKVEALIREYTTARSAAFLMTMMEIINELREQPNRDLHDRLFEVFQKIRKYVTSSLEEVNRDLLADSFYTTLIVASILSVLNVSARYMTYVMRSLLRIPDEIAVSLRERVNVSIRVRKDDEDDIKVEEFSVKLNKLRLSITLKPPNMEIIIGDDKYTLTLEEDSYSSIENIVKTIRDITPIIESLIMNLKAIYVPQFRSEPRLFIPYHEERCHAELVPVSDLSIARDLQELDYVENLAREMRLRRCARILKRYFGVDDVRIVRKPGTGTFILVRRGKTESPLMLSGSDLYFILPIVLKCAEACLHANSLVVVEHPEASLSCSRQPRIVDFLSDLAFADLRNRAVIIETSSPLIFFRILKRMLVDDVAYENTAIYLFEINTDYNRARILKIDTGYKTIKKVLTSLLGESMEDYMLILDIAKIGINEPQRSEKND